ncbi:hypothetical protein BG015_005218 [Linnemannia schmuckeri]|uniref:Protein kinase domain-containing protein n=1 Tax=Linnemannia schmuckeri TaxID=64567 RepID=A0A9P5UX23_9FUNG|nr:hypothetical protein BG015_005218 [Linnemannia schmuckeri]
MKRTKKKVLHRDLKPQNILLAKGVAKIADLGMAMWIVDPCEAYIGKEVQDFVEPLLQSDARLRPYIGIIIAHKFFKEMADASGSAGSSFSCASKHLKKTKHLLQTTAASRRSDPVACVHLLGRY